MTDTDTTTNLAHLAAGTSDVQAAIDAGLALAEPHKLDDEGRFYSVAVPAGAELHVIDLEEHLDKFRDRPRRKTGGYAVHDAFSFISYLEKHVLMDTEVWADVTRQSVVAVINAHGPAEAGWADHYVELKLHQTPAWKAWTALHRRPLTQVQFAEHLEDQRVDVVDPDAATLTEIARTFKAKKSVLFDQSEHLSTGQVQLRYHEEIDAKAGAKGDIEVPETFKLGLQPFEGSERYEVGARLRFDISTGQLTITYVLDRPEEIMRRAFSDVLEEIENAVVAPVYRGMSH